MKVLPIPESELKLFKDLIVSNPNYFDSAYLSKIYKKASKKLFKDPFSKDVVRHIIMHIKQKKPMSIIRMGDGEMNLLAYTKYPRLPELSFLTALESVSKRQHSFIVDKSWLYILEEMMFTAVAEADIVGVLGLWRPNLLTAEQFLPTINKNIRGRWGQWIGLDYMLQLSKINIFKTKLLASAHLYFSVIQNLDLIFKTVKTVYLVTNQRPVLKKLRDRYLANQFILVDETPSKRPLIETKPFFLYNIMNKLPRNLTGTLTLIGAGPWSEFFCTCKTRRGGVAIDIGSGFDLLLGKKSRPVHSKVVLNLYY